MSDGKDERAGGPMKVAILGYGIEGKSVYRYLKINHPDYEIVVFDEKDIIDKGVEIIQVDSLLNVDFTLFDIIVRSPSIPLISLRKKIINDKNGDEGFELTSATKIFFDKCPAKIIGVTGTKGKGTISSLITEILRASGANVHLVGNIGTSSLDALPSVKKGDIVVYELSSFQLWGLKKSPWTAVVGRVEPDHLNVHVDMGDYVMAKGNIARWQYNKDKIVYYGENKLSQKIGNSSPASSKLMYPSGIGAHVSDGWICFKDVKICEVSVLKIPGKHNIENALAAVSVCFDMVAKKDIIEGLTNFKGLPHRLELVRDVSGVRYYDDNFSSATPATEVAVQAFIEPVILIAGGADRGLIYNDFIKFLNQQDNLKKVILIGKTAGEMRENLSKDYEIAESISDAVIKAKQSAEKGDVVIMSPGAPSFDMFRDFRDRAEQYKKVVEDL